MWTLIKALFKAAPFSLYLDAAIVAAVVTLFLAFGRHERTVQYAIDQKAQVAAVQQAKAQALIEHAEMQAQVDKSSEDAKNAQAQLDQFTAANPIGSVRVCHAPSNSPGNVPSPGKATPGATGALAGSSSVPAVPEGTAGPDISAGLNTLVQAAGRLAVLEQERQRNPQ
jgi:hypothetical protein